MAAGLFPADEIEALDKAEEYRRKAQDIRAETMAIECMVIYEALIDDDDVRTACGAEEYQDRNGTASLRQLIFDKIAPITIAAWDAMTDEDKDNSPPWDWRWMPDFLHTCIRISPSGDVEVLPGVPKSG